MPPCTVRGPLSLGTLPLIFKIKSQCGWAVREGLCRRLRLNAISHLLLPQTRVEGFYKKFTN